MVEAATNAQIKEIFERNERTVRSDRRKKTVGKAELWVTELDALLERIRTAEADKARLSEALRNIAEGNLGDAPWQANYDKIREVARAVLSGSSSGWRAMDSAPETGFFLAWSPDFPDMVSCWKAEIFHQARKPGTPRHLSANHFTLWRPLDLPAAPQQGGE